ncbi:ABC transporter substrate-binding protein [Bifidobacterium avesanii]|uniref:Extracellular solute-binding protein n=1 Tax=Bifidobacterium avesanii TaxID=1798157 RepID=A0A7K3TI28_9BIFI|nr:extracellular solute-binding protein [Bifidobacterium avesanii]KAB8290990.1 Bacterial extracellular solute-binding protein [Bifidobacterium avesanii]NEG78757.1 extracellular solute-binding protein [Bifidobacterium avesanii]
MKRTTMFTRLVASAAALGMTFGMAACGAADASDGKTADGKVQITLSWWGSEKRLKLTQQAVELFEQKHPNIKVNMENSDYGGYFDKLNISIAGGTAPDVFQIGTDHIPVYGSQGSLMDLSQVSDALDLTQMTDAVRATGQFGGVQYAAPVSLTSLGIAVNNTVLKDLGLTLPADADSWTWDEFEAFERQIVEKSNGEITAAGTPLGTYGLQLWARQHGEELFKDGKVSVSKKVATSYFEEFKKAVDEQLIGTADRWAENQNANTEISDAGTGKQAMLFTHATQLSAFSAASGTEDWSLVMVPTDTPQTKFMYNRMSMSWAVSAQSKHPKEAAELLDFMINDLDAAKILGTERGIPANPKVREVAKQNASDIEKKVMDFVDKTEKASGIAPPDTPNGVSDSDNYIMRCAQDIAFGSKTPEQAAQSYIDDLTNSIASAS